MSEERGRDARAEARARLDGRFEPRVLEPSPPAVTEGPWYADDPVNCPLDRPGCLVVSPVPNADVTWDELARDDPDLSPWCTARWLGAWRPLPAVPSAAALARTRRSLHVLP